MDNFVGSCCRGRRGCHDLEEIESHPIGPLDLEGDVGKDKEPTFGIVNVLQAVEGTDDRAGQCPVGGRRQGPVLCGMDKVCAHEQVWILQVIL